MDLTEIWESIDSRMDWLISGVILLVVLNIIVPVYVGWIYLSQKSFHRKHKLQRSSLFVRQAKKLQDLPNMDDIEVPRTHEDKSLPSQYVKLQKTDLFLPLGSRDVSIPTAKTVEGDTGEKEVEKQLPVITGYEIVGRISGKGDAKASIVRKTSSEGESGEKLQTFIGREGEFLGNTDVKVVSISDTMVILKDPEHRETKFQFEVDKISEKIRQSIRLY